MSVEGGPGPEFLKQKYDLHTSDEVESAKERTEVRTGEQLPHNTDVLIQNYLDRFKEITDREDPEQRERGIEALKKVLHDKFVIKPEKVPESAFLLEQRIAKEQGWGEVEITDEFKERKTEQIINNQTQSLDKWLDYLTSDDAQYPDWAKYWAIRSVLNMGKLEKKEDEQGRETANFSKRESSTVASFPPLNPRAFALTIGILREKLDEQAKSKADRQPVNNQSIRLSDLEFQRLLSTENFSKIYSQFLIEMPEYSAEGLEEIRGEWKTFPKDSDAQPLIQSLEGHPLEWCIADLSTAQDYLQGGDIHIYYSNNQSGKAIVPRVAIRMQDDKIAEVRGIAPNQNVDPYISPVIEKKMEEFGQEGKAYEKKSADMKFLTTIERKVGFGDELSKDELFFLYEIDQPIEGFGYQRDPRIEELRSQRNAVEDAPIVLECQPEEIAWSADQIQENTKSYIGPLFPGIFKLQNLENIYTSFPEGKVRKSDLEIGGKTKDELVAELKAKGIKISDYAQDMLDSPDFTSQPNPEQIDLVRLKVRDLGFPDGATTDQIYAKAEEFGLELCPAEVGPYQRLKDQEQPLGDWYRVAMKQISDRRGNPNVFRMEHNGDGLWLNNDRARPDRRWNADRGFLFRLRNVSHAA